MAKISNNYKIIWWVLGIVGTIVAATWAVSDHYVPRTEYTGSMIQMERRLDRIENKLDKALENNK